MTAYRPDKACFVHACTTQGRAPMAVPARFLVACNQGHLDDFPWLEFVHRGPTDCQGPLYLYEVGASGEAADVEVVCGKCKEKGARRRMAEAFGRDNQKHMPACRGRRPHLRDFQSATGETFNKKGKTDILIRHEKENVFVAECKFWNGIKAFHKTIDQLLGYLTWRDSKAAVVSFVRNKELTPVLEAIEKETPSHACFVKYQGKKKDGWFMFEFHLPGDAGRSVHRAVLVFHFP